MNNPLIELHQVSFNYGKNEIIRNLDLTIDQPSIVSIMGPSGSGKSTVLRIISGLETPSSGTVSFDGLPVLRPPRNLRYSFQDYDAFPWRTVEQNLILFSRLSKDKSVYSEFGSLLRMVGLSAHGNKYPAQLSGGMRKRLALGRCIAGAPKAILLDEPFSSLDVAARDELHMLVLDLAKQMSCTFVIVTHDIHEAVFLSSKVIIATSLPFRIDRIVDVPFTYPRNQQLHDLPEFDSTCGEIRSLLVRLPTTRAGGRPM